VAEMQILSFFGRVLPFICIAMMNSALVGCSDAPSAKGPPGPIEGKDYQFSFVDIPMEERIKLTLVSLSSRELCIGNTSWPTENGFMENPSQRTAILVDGTRFPYKDFDMEACQFKACGNPIKNGMQLNSSLFYSYFGLPQRLYKSPKELTYSPQPIWCDMAHWIDRPSKHKGN
jgi:hypothetical protein